jgi:predicted RNA-binding Zn ribbon-like protein
VVIDMKKPAPHDHAVDLETALDFVNTLKFDDGLTIELLGTTSEALDWLHGHGLVHHEALGRADEEATLRRIRRTRAALRELADATYERRRPRQHSVDEVNRALRAREVVQLVPSRDGLRLDHRHVGDPVDDALANLADPIVREIAAGRPERLRACADDTCRWIFYDDSRTGRRRWCDMASCGNRAKAARHRARAKAADQPADRPA